MVYFLCFLIWYVAGYSGFVFHFTRQFDYGLIDVFFASIMAFMGPLTWIVGFFIFTKREKGLIKKRETNAKK